MKVTSKTAPSGKYKYKWARQVARHPECNASFSVCLGYAISAHNGLPDISGGVRAVNTIVELDLEGMQIFITLARQDKCREPDLLDWREKQKEIGVLKDALILAVKKNRKFSNQ